MKLSIEYTQGKNNVICFFYPAVLSNKQKSKLVSTILP